MALSFLTSPTLSPWFSHASVAVQPNIQRIAQPMRKAPRWWSYPHTRENFLLTSMTKTKAAEECEEREEDFIIIKSSKRETLSFSYQRSLFMKALSPCGRLIKNSSSHANVFLAFLLLRLTSLHSRLGTLLHFWWISVVSRTEHDVTLNSRLIRFVVYAFARVDTRKRWFYRGDSTWCEVFCGISFNELKVQCSSSKFQLELSHYWREWKTNRKIPSMREISSAETDRTSSEVDINFKGIVMSWLKSLTWNCRDPSKTSTVDSKPLNFTNSPSSIWLWWRCSISISAKICFISIKPERKSIFPSSFDVCLRRKFFQLKSAASRFTRAQDAAGRGWELCN